jgi:hypothetical protein
MKTLSSVRPVLRDELGFLADLQDQRIDRLLAVDQEPGRAAAAIGVGDRSLGAVLVEHDVVGVEEILAVIAGRSRNQPSARRRPACPCWN